MNFLIINWPKNSYIYWLIQDSIPN